MRREIYRPIFLLQLMLAASMLVASAAAQSPTPFPSPTPGQTLADIARQEKAHQEKEKQQQKSASREFSNEDIASAHDTDSASTAAAASRTVSGRPSNSEKLTAAQWSENIRAQKQQIGKLQEQADELKASIHYVYAQDSNEYSIENQAWRVRYNTVQKRKQDQVDQMQQQIESEKKDLEEMQDACRKQDYGTNVCDAS